MDKLTNLIGQPLNFRLWVDGLVALQYGMKTLDEKKAFNDTVFNGGIQKVILLAVLLFACSFTFWTSKNIAPDQIDEIFSKTFLATVVSGFAIYLLCNVCLYALTSNIETARYCCNVLILHLAVSLSVMLIANVTTFSAYVDSYFYSVFGGAKYAAGSLSAMFSAPVALASLFITYKNMKIWTKQTFEILIKFVFFWSATATLLFAYLNQQIIAL